MSTGLWQLVRLQWRTNRGMLLAAPILLAGMVAAVAAGIAELYPQAAQREVYRQTMGASPAAAAFNGRGYDLETLGGIAAYEVGFMGQLALPIVGLLMTIRLTRRMEDSGILELVTSGRVSRTAVPLAAKASSAGAWLLFTLLTWAALAVQDFPVTNSLRYAVILALFGMAFSAAGLVLAQVAGNARSATSAGICLVLAAFLARAVVDGSNRSWTWASPMGWVAEAHPWGSWQWWPAVSFLAATAASVAVAVGMAARRDLGAGLWAVRPGRRVAPRRLASPWGLAWRLGARGVLGWWFGSLVWAAAIGSMSQEFLDVVKANPSLAEAFGGDVAQLSTTLSLLLTSVMAVAAGLGVALRPGAEELTGRQGLLEAGTVARWRWWVACTGLGILATVLITVSSAFLLGLVQWRVTDASRYVTAAVRGGLWLVAPCVLLVCVGALLVAWRPRWRGLAWLAVTWTAVVGILGEPLRLPEWARNLSPLHLVGNVPAEPGSSSAVVALAVASAVALALGAVTYRRRDLARG